MPYNSSTGVYTPPLGAENAANGQIIQPTTWNSIFTDISTALTTVGELIIPQNSNAVWTTFAPSVTAAAGTLTTVSVTGRYTSFGNLICCEMSATVTANGNGTGAIYMSLPVNATLGVANGVALVGREDHNTGVMLNAYAVNSGTIAVVTATNSYPVTAAGAVIRIGGTYEGVS